MKCCIPLPFVRVVMYCRESWTSNICCSNGRGGLAKGVSLGVTSADLLKEGGEVVLFPSPHFLSRIHFDDI